jgi:lambda family phage tail tape measure protein
VLREQAKWSDWQQEMADIEKAWADSAAEVTKNRAKESADTLTEFAKSAAQNMQSSFADFLYDPFKDGVDGMVENFADALRRMMAEAAAAQILESLGKAASGVEGDSWWATIARGIGGALSKGGKAEGGYTGPGGKYEPAGVVHKGEIVWSQADIARAGGVGIVESMRLGMLSANKPAYAYANGGWVGENGDEIVVAGIMVLPASPAQPVIACHL